MSRFILPFIMACVLSSQAWAWSGVCERVGSSSKFPEYGTALRLLAKRLQYTEDQLCHNPRILDIYGDHKILLNKETQEPELHVWMTIHYDEYSCQYFFRQADWHLTQSNCYNTW